MIASLEGIVTATGNDYVVMVVNGVGYKVFVPPAALNHITHDNMLLHTSMVVREDSITLYGFLTATDRDLFEIITTVSGIGPKIGITMLSVLGADQLRVAVVTEQVDLLVRVPGIGKKTAQKAILELKDKLKSSLDSIPAASFNDTNRDVMDTLVALGYSIAEAQNAIQALPPDAPEDVEERVRLALRYFISG